MDTLNIAENIIRLRKKRGLTQEELATFIGVTKASVSKWENGQSMPDILILPSLASYFDVTVDELLGYKPQLSKEQIQAIYKTLAHEFSEQPFESVFEKSVRYVKKYYSCYRFLLQMCVLWANHYMMAESEGRQKEILQEIEKLCNHIICNCNNAIICSDAIMMRAGISLQLGKPEQTIAELEELINPNRLINQSDSMLIQAYMMKGDVDRANRFVQISMYTHLFALVSDAVQFLSIHIRDESICNETMKRTDKLIKAYALEGLFQHIAAVYEYQAAAVLCSFGRHAEAIDRLERYAKLIVDMLENAPRLHGDSYFSHLDECFEELELGAVLVRDKKVVLKSAIGELQNPVFEGLKNMKEYKVICKQLESVEKAIM